ncbi:recombinase family protein [Pannus brasiliensis CCIBt3594]|uniref:Recombinase family protein n=1 Tax=Pannus brasiliensis CCIBt3594 TaxID=1427578 RepID=A0AAW9QK40_9CHRO
MTVIAYIYRDPLLETLPDGLIGGIAVDRVYRDSGERTALQQLLRDCRENPPRSLIVRRLAEFGDTAIEVSECLQRLESLGIEIVALEEPNYRTEIARILHEIEKNRQISRLKEGHARNRLKALPPPGKAPYGYRRGKDRYLLDRTTAPVVKDFFDRFLLTGSLRGSVKYLEKRYGKKISVSSARDWLTNPVYRGDLLYLNREIIPDTHAPILSREEAAGIDRLLRNHRLFAPRSASAPRSLAGLVACAECGSRMTVTRVNRRGSEREYLYLRSRECPRQPKCPAIDYDRFLNSTIEKICQDLPVAIARLSLPDLGGIKGEIEGNIQKNRDILQKLADLQREGILDEETANLRAYKLNNEIARLQARLDQLPPGNLPVIAREVAFPQFWRDLSESERRFYFREFIRRVEIDRSAENGEWAVRLVFVF